MIGSFKKIAYTVCGVGVALFVACSSALAFDIPEYPEKKNNPFEVFKFGLSAFKSGHKDEALKALRYAADQGHPGANWKLASMYAHGDGVPENDYEAYKIFEKIVHEGAEPGSQNESYVAGALVQLARYVKGGIPDSPVASDPAMARDLYVQAASNFGDPTAQYELGAMLLKGDGVEKNKTQAARWFQLAARKGNTNAQAMLGNMLFQAGKTVRGLAMLTSAFERCVGHDCEWIRAMQEEAFSVARESDRRNAIALLRQH